MWKRARRDGIQLTFRSAASRERQNGRRVALRFVSHRESGLFTATHFLRPEAHRAPDAVRWRPAALPGYLARRRCFQSMSRLRSVPELTWARVRDPRQAVLLRSAYEGDNRI